MAIKEKKKRMNSQSNFALVRIISLVLLSFALSNTPLTSKAPGHRQRHDERERREDAPVETRHFSACFIAFRRERQGKRKEERRRSEK